MEPNDVDDDYIDIEDDDVKALPNTFPKPKHTKDSNGYSFVTVVDVSGVHFLPCIPCICPGSKEHDMQYLELGLLASSYIDIKTVFTLALLEDFHMSNLECKTTAYQYYQKIRRVTCPAFPRLVPNRYRELRRASRQYRDLKARQFHGTAYGISTPSKGRLAIFCAACPQKGINYREENYYDDPEKAWLLRRSFVADGNFKADHVKQKNEADDVNLSSGEAYMTEQEPYLEHLKEMEKIAPRFKRKDTCHNYHATLDALKTIPGVDRTGMGVLACARHGCFCPSSAVDFQRGERQMNMDWSVCEALKTANISGAADIVLIYDIMCQYHVNLYERVAASSKLSLPDTINIIKAIGQFHVHGHQEACLYRFSTSFIPQIGIVDGEILETLWSNLNLISRSTRTASLPHRCEIIDDHMRDSNFKKIINTGPTIVKKYLRAVLKAQESTEYYNDLTASADPGRVETWTQEIQFAEARRHEDETAMDIMKSRIKKPLGRKAIELIMAEKELLQAGETGQTAWISSGLRIVEDQLKLQAHVRQMSLHPTVKEKTDLVSRRQRLCTRIDKYYGTAVEYLGPPALAAMSDSPMDLPPDNPVLILSSLQQSDDPEAHASGQPDLFFIRSSSDPEKQLLVFPSSIPLSVRNTSHIHLLLQKEKEILYGLAADSIDTIKEVLVQMSWQFTTKVRLATTNKQNSRAWSEIRALKKHLRHHRAMYNMCRLMLKCHPGMDLLSNDHFPPLKDSDLQASQSIADPNAPGLRYHRLAWIWTWTPPISEFQQSLAIYRVHWLRARAENNRWKEELELTCYEMQWTTRFYMYMAELWAKRRNHCQEKAGFKPYAEQQIGLWNDMGRITENLFCRVNTSHPRIWQPVRHLN
ncbi:hypothetical protein CPC08DRAFT_649410 [Agrocybe pediades]|nr:hypothetical protein CPC08DRAFT_649410 [Agrocybe pediades]